MAPSASGSGSNLQRAGPAVAVALIALSAGAPAVQAGERLSVRQLVERADAIVKVRVGIGRAPAVRVLEVVRGDPAALPPSVSALTGVCVPDRRLLDEWIRRPDYYEGSAPLWRAALKRGRYDAVIFLRRGADGLRAVCETETLLAEHWTTHPRHRAWRSTLDAALAGPAR